MTERDEKYREKYVEAVAPHVEGEVEAIGLFSRAGSMGAAVLSQVSPLAGALKLGRGRKKGGGLPMNVVLAVTHDKVYAFDFKPKGFGLKIKETAAVWDRAAVRVAPTSEGVLADRLEVRIGDAEPIELDSNKMPGLKSEFNEPLIRLLG